MRSLIGTVNAGYTIKNVAARMPGTKWYAIATNGEKWVTWRIYGNASDPDFEHGNYFNGVSARFNAEVDFGNRIAWNGSSLDGYGFRALS